MKRRYTAKKSAAQHKPSNRLTRAELFTKSTTSTAQRTRILEALRLGPKSSYELRRLGCYQCPTRIKELRDRFGCVIETARITVVDQDGYSHSGVALYTLIAEGALCSSPTSRKHSAREVAEC